MILLRIQVKLKLKRKPLMNKMNRMLTKRLLAEMMTKLKMLPMRLRRRPHLRVGEQPEAGVDVDVDPVVGEVPN